MQFCLLLLFLFLGASAGAQQKAPSRVDFSVPFELAGPPPFEPFSVREGMPELRRKLEAGQPVTIAFLGGSITQNAEKEGFIEALRAWAAKKFPAARIRTINAGIPATNSNWGAARIEHDVLGEKPDAVFVEFAVNDGERDSRADMERIVRRIRQADPQTDVAFLYATSEPAFNNKLRKGKTHEAIRFHEAVAAHYGLPSLIFGNDLYRQIASGGRPWSEFFQDDCHPTSEGYASYSRDMDGFLAAVFSAAPRKKSADPQPLVAEANDPVQTAAPEPMRDPEPMIHRELGQATDTWALPVLGLQWMGSPSFPQADQEWQLSYAVLGDAGGDAKSADWQPARWFAEGRGFTGPNSYVLAKPSEKWGSTLSMFPAGTAQGVSVPQITWSAPRPGKYIVKVQAESVSGSAQNTSAAAGLGVFCRRKGSPGEDRMGMAAAAPGGGFTLHLSSDLEAGDCLSFRLNSSNFEFCSIESVEIGIGRFDASGGNLSRVR
jgi:lysophospholipase L1-like esterase